MGGGTGKLCQSRPRRPVATPGPWQLAPWYVSVVQSADGPSPCPPLASCGRSCTGEADGRRIVEKRAPRGAQTVKPKLAKTVPILRTPGDTGEMMREAWARDGRTVERALTPETEDEGSERRERETGGGLGEKRNAGAGSGLTLGAPSPLVSRAPLISYGELTVPI